MGNKKAREIDFSARRMRNMQFLSLPPSIPSSFPPALPTCREYVKAERGQTFDSRPRNSQILTVPSSEAEAKKV